MAKAPEAAVHTGGDVDGILNYQAADVERVWTKRDGAGSDMSLDGAVWDSRRVLVRNGREQRDLTLDTAGFALLPDEKGAHIDYYDEHSVVHTYYKDCESLLKGVTGATHCYAFDHNIRSTSGNASGRRLRGGNLVQGPAGLVHGDYTATSAPKRLALLAQPPKLNDALRPVLGEKPLLPAALADEALRQGRRFAFINVWRPISTVQCKPLACCDASTVASDDLLVFEIHYSDRVGENYFARHRSSHRWNYFPSMTRDEVLLLKQWDSDGALDATCLPSGIVGQLHALWRYAVGGRKPATFSLHSAFEDPSSPAGCPDRESIEVRCVLIY